MARKVLLFLVLIAVVVIVTVAFSSAAGRKQRVQQAVDAAVATCATPEYDAKLKDAERQIEKLDLRDRQTVDAAFDNRLLEAGCKQAGMPRHRRM